jgi:serine/threonine protein phosphatase PrpC
MARAEVELAWKTQAGHRHQVEGLVNEDAVYVTRNHPSFDAVLMVADGMGGHPRPADASSAAVRAAKEFLHDAQRLRDEKEPLKLLVGALQAAHRAVRRLRGTETRAPGTTLSLAVLAEGTLHVAHVGDGSVYLMREGQIHPIAGGEELREGNRPSQFLGQERPPEPELRRVTLAQGDRFLLCTDGLTRYFHEAGPEAMERVLSRKGVEIQSIASQLTAQGRPSDYDDDTTVALAEVTAVRSDTVPVKTEKQSRDSSDGRGPSGMAVPLIAGAAGALAILVCGFALGRVTAPGRSSDSGSVSIKAAPVSPDQLKKLPPGNLILIDSLERRVYSLGTRAQAQLTDPVELQAYEVVNGKLVNAGLFGYDPSTGLLDDHKGNRYPVSLDPAGASFHVLAGGNLTVNSKVRGAQVFINGKYAGTAPYKTTLRAGEYDVVVRSRKRVLGQTRVPIAAGQSLTVEPGS